MNTRLSVQMTVTGAFSLLVLVIAIFQITHFPGAYEERGREGLESKGVAIAGMGSKMLAAAVEFDDRASTEDVFNALSGEEDLVFIAVFKEGNLFAASDESKVPSADALSLAAGDGIDHTKDQIIVRRRVAGKSNMDAVVVAGLSLTRIQQANTANQRATIVTGIAVLLFGFLVSLGLGRHVRRRIAALENAADQVRETTNEIRTASQELLASSRQQSEGAAQQASAVEETRRTMETLLAASSQINTTARSVLRNAEATQKVNQLVAERIQTLTEHTQRISEILDVIKDIANKSELLALNAALEGTKAGEAGRGFSLVAVQMQRLAENVMQSVRDIKDLTNDVRGSTQATVLATEEATKLARGTTESANQIALIIQQQQSGTEQVSRALDDIVDIAQRTSDASRDSVSSIRHLLELSDRGTAMLRNFHGTKGGEST